jgi:hypothetical protein
LFPPPGPLLPRQPIHGIEQILRKEDHAFVFAGAQFESDLGEARPDPRADLTRLFRLDDMEFRRGGHRRSAHSPECTNEEEDETEGEEAMVPDEAARVIQRLARGFLARKRVVAAKHAELVFIGMVDAPLKPTERLWGRPLRRLRRPSLEPQWLGPMLARGKPPCMVSSCSTVTASLPFSPNSGMYSATGAVSSSAPLAISGTSANCTIVFVALKITNRCASVAVPNDRPATTRPWSPSAYGAARERPLSISAWMRDSSRPTASISMLLTAASNR